METVRKRAEIGRRLQIVHGVQWLYATSGAPCAEALRGFGDVTGAVDRIRRSGAVVAARGGGWVSARHDVAVAALTHPLLEPPHAGGPYAPQRPVPLPATLLHAEPPSGVDSAELAASAAAAVVAELPAEVDLVPALAARLPAALLSDVLAVPEAELRPPAEATGPLADAVLCAQTLAATTAMLDSAAELDRRLDDPGRLLVATLGVTLSSTLLGNALNRVLEHPAEWDRFGECPGHAAHVVAETLRLDPPVDAYPLVAGADLELAGQTVRAGEQVVLLLAGAGRDPDRYERPEEFRPHSGAVAPVPGAPFARLLPMARAVAVAALTALTGRFARAERTGNAVRAYRAPVTRRLLSLPARLVSREEVA